MAGLWGRGMSPKREVFSRGERGRGGNLLISSEASRFPNYTTSFLQCSCYLLSPK